MQGVVEKEKTKSLTFQEIRKHSEWLCQPLEIEDYCVQPFSEVSPPKWHLAHTTWFFEEMILVPFYKGYKRFNESYTQLFNSYYKGAGKHWIQAQRGQLSRPTVNDIMRYRLYVDEYMSTWMNSEQLTDEQDKLLNIGLNHEEQHQELLLMDIKMIFGVSPLSPIYSHTELPLDSQKEADWVQIKEGVTQLGYQGQGFAYDNEMPRHSVYMQNADICPQVVSNKEYLEFILDGGYLEPRLWLSQGWDWVQKNKITCPLYWHKIDGKWFEFTLHGLYPLPLNNPVCHISYFEANAFANWKKMRLPTEIEMEYFLGDSKEGNRINVFHPISCHDPVNQVWCWTQSQYLPYPGFKTFDGVLGEYNGKFMCNQFVLRGGCIATPKGHYRKTYRNFYLPEQRWMFSGIRLVR